MAAKTRSLQEIMDEAFSKPLTDRKGKYARDPEEEKNLPHIDDITDDSDNGSEDSDDNGKTPVKKSFPVWRKRD